MKRKQLHDAHHLTFAQREIIQAGILNGATKTAIARTIGKDATTVAKEIRLHRTLQPRTSYQRGVACARQPQCPTKRCTKKCELFKETNCKRRDRSPGACNGCPKAPYCHMDRYLYNAGDADKAYRHLLRESREGINLTTSECEEIAAILAPLLNKGQSVHQIYASHPELTVSERTIYSYICSSVFKPYGIDYFSLKEKVNRRPRVVFKKRKETFNVEGRRYSDFQRFCSDNPDVPIVEMDTLYNDPSGPYIQTLHFRKTSLMIGFLHSERTCDSMSSTFNRLQSLLGNDLFSALFPVILTDRGSEFIKFKLFELDANGQQRLSLFYCDPMQASQKPFIENNHNYVRDIIPNGFPINQLSQDDLYLMFSHINSTPRLSLNDRTPYETFCFFYGSEPADLLGIQSISRDDVILKPWLIFDKSTRASSAH